MAQVVFDGNYKVFLAETIADRDAPTVTEITDGDDITDQCPKDFLNWGKSQGRVNAGTIATDFSAERMGTWTMGATLQLFRDGDNDPVSTGVVTNKGTKTLVILPDGGSGTNGDPDSGDMAFVAAVEFGMPTPTNPAENERQRWELDTAITEEPTFQAVVASP